MDSAAIVWPLFNSLQAFWPGLQVNVPFRKQNLKLHRAIDDISTMIYLIIFKKVLAGDVEPAVRTHAAFYSVWKKYGFTPEGFNLATLSVQVISKHLSYVDCIIYCVFWKFDFRMGLLR